MKRVTFGLLVVAVVLALGISAQAQPRIGSYDSRNADFAVDGWSETLYGGGEGQPGNEIEAASEGFYDFSGATLRRVTPVTPPQGAAAKYRTIYKGGTLVLLNDMDAPWYNAVDEALGVTEYVASKIRAKVVSTKFDDGKMFFVLTFTATFDDYPCFAATVTARSKKQKPLVTGTGDLDSDPYVISGDLKWATIEISGPEILPVAVDIKPGSCPNPINVKSNGVLPVAIVNTGFFDIEDIDPDTIQLEGVPPLRWSYEDVATPYGNPCDELVVEKCECNELGPDGFVDLVLHFDTQDIVAALGEVCDGQVLVLELNAELFDGTFEVHGSLA